MKPVKKKKLPSPRLEIGATEGKRKKDNFEWRCVRTKGKITNVLYFGIGYDSYGSALRAAKAMNGKLIKEIPIYHRGELI